MKHQALFSSKDKSKLQLVSSATSFVGILWVKVDCWEGRQKRSGREL